MACETILHECLKGPFFNLQRASASHAALLRCIAGTPACCTTSSTTGSAGLDKTGQGQREKRCAVQSELLCCAHLNIESRHHDSVNQDTESGISGSSPGRLLTPRCSSAILYCARVVARSTDIEIEDLYEAYMLMSYKILSAEIPKNTARTLEPGEWKRCVLARPQNHRPMS